MTSILVALYRGQSADPIFNAAHGLVTIDFLDVACRLLLNPTRYTESPRRNAGSVSENNFISKFVQTQWSRSEQEMQKRQTTKLFSFHRKKKCN